MTNLTARGLLRSTCGVAFLALGCTQPAGNPGVVPRDTVVRVDTVPDPASVQRVGVLQLRVLERDAQLQALERRLEEAMREVVRSMARQQSLATRAEAASAMAEAEVALRELRTRGGVESLPEIPQAARYLELSTIEFNENNFGGALYLANQAKAVASEGRARLADMRGEPLRPGEVRFAVPVSLEATTRSNVREGPGTRFAVVFTVEAGARVTGQSHADQWVLIVDGGGRSGWIHFDLVRPIR